jgi:hypothetical protein
VTSSAVTLSASSGLITGRIRPPASTMSAKGLSERCRSRFHQWTKSLLPQILIRQPMDSSGTRRTCLIVWYGMRFSPQGK